MQIQKTQNTPHNYNKRNISFQQLEIVHISKKSANCIQKAEDILWNYLEKHSGAKNQITLLEYPYYQKIQDYLMKANKPSIWLSKKQRIEIPKINKEGYYTYICLSEEESEQFVERILNQLEGVYKKNLEECKFFNEDNIRATLMTCNEFFRKTFWFIKEVKNKKEIFI